MKNIKEYGVGVNDVVVNKEVVFRGLDCDYDENNEPIIGDDGNVAAIFSFNAVIPKGFMDSKSRTYYKDVAVDVTMSLTVNHAFKFIELHSSAMSFAAAWYNSALRNELHVLECDMARMGILFSIDGYKRLGIKKPETLTELHLPKQYIANEEIV